LFPDIFERLLVDVADDYAAARAAEYVAEWIDVHALGAEKIRFAIVSILDARYSILVDRTRGQLCQFPCSSACEAAGIFFYSIDILFGLGRRETFISTGFSVLLPANKDSFGA
jgi:hypothetical protein